jgi:hypothetical protein
MLSYRPAVYRRLRRILLCSNADASYIFSRSQRFRLHVTYRLAATRATTQVQGIIGRKELSSQHILFLGLDSNACANGRLLEEKLRDLFR